MDINQRPALGVDTPIGSFYDAHKDIFLQGSLFTGDVPTDSQKVSWRENKEVSFSNSDTLQAKFTALGMPSSLAASYLAGWVAVEGSGVFLRRLEPDQGEVKHHTLHYTRSTVLQELDLDAAVVQSAINSASAAHRSTATHVVTQIIWGARCSITATSVDSSQAVRFSKARFRLSNSLDGDVDLRTVIQTADDIFDPKSQLLVHSDLSPGIFSSPVALSLVKQHLERLDDLSQTGHADARPLYYTLTPIDNLFGSYQYTDSRRDECGQLHQTDFQSILSLHEKFIQNQRSSEKYSKRLKRHRSSIPVEHVFAVSDALENIKEAKSNFESEFSRLLSSIRFNQDRASAADDFIGKYSRGSSSPDSFVAIIGSASHKMDLKEELLRQGAQCVEYQSSGPPAFPANCYIFYFSDKAMKQPTWSANRHLVTQVLEDKSRVLPFFAMDCDAEGGQLEEPRISYIKNGRLKIANIVEHRKHEASLCFIRFAPESVDTSVKDTPSQHKPLSIPCPGEGCGNSDRDWICLKCRVRVEYGVVDPFLYCDCGRAHRNSATFNCQRSHGQAFSRHNPDRLQKLLDGLPTPPEINLLILGETGVGKSTFINSFINYLSYETLTEALSMKKLECIIPCSFFTQSVDPDGRLQHQEVKIGQDKDEYDGSTGQSATQQATVYPVYFGGGLIRLIDTPGIGDTRGPDQDRLNMRNIVQVLRNYESLHGIVILLKPNNARLNVMFRFSINELLTQLHRNAAENMVFGFTNTRGSNYRPGDTFKPLENLLKNYDDVIKGLFHDTVYCFDSESFRYLAARHQGIDMGHLDDYKRSWDHSAAEVRRMVAYFRTKTPHEIRSTVSLNETRYLITQLIQPMAQITTAIADTVQKNKKKIQELQNTQLHGNKLRENLQMTKTIIDTNPLDRPRTVCSNSQCCTYTKNEDQGGTSVNIFKSLCHDPCSLRNVPVDVVGPNEIPPCAAFSGHENCQICGHHWREHQHVMVLYSERTETTTDPAVENALVRNHDEASAKKMQINALNKIIKELETEHQMIQESQARFSHYLKQHSITHYNDATIDYDHLIKDERSKMTHGGNRTRLEQLEKDKSKYQNFADAMEMGKKDARHAPLDENGVYALVQKLYSMKHYGANLKDCAKNTGQAYAATFRERPYRVRKRNFGSSSSDYNVFGSVRPSMFSSRGRSEDFQAAKPKPPVPPKPQKKGSIWSAQSQSKNKPTKNPAPCDQQDVQANSQNHRLHVQRPIEASLFLHESDDSDDGDGRRTSSAQVPALVTQPSNSHGGGVKNQLYPSDSLNTRLMDEKGAKDTQRIDSGAWSNSRDLYNQGGFDVSPLPNDISMYSRGGVVPVTIDSGDPQRPYGPQVLQKKKSKWFSNIKSKLKGGGSGQNIGYA